MWTGRVIWQNPLQWNKFICKIHKTMVKLRIHNTYQGDDFTMAKDYSAITPDILKLSELCSGNSVINSEMYLEHKVFRGLRDLNGNGVLTG